jgi:hypothetical protein
MTARYAWIALAAAAAFGLAACETDEYSPASAGVPASTSPTTPGSSTGTPPGSDANVKGAGSAGSTVTPPPAE